MEGFQGFSLPTLQMAQSFEQLAKSSGERKVNSTTTHIRTSIRLWDDICQSKKPDLLRRGVQRGDMRFKTLTRQEPICPRTFSCGAW